MVFRRSLRKKLAYTFLACALLMVVLFSLVIKAIITDYFERQSVMRLEFVREQGKQSVRTNLAIFKDGFQEFFRTGTAALNAICRPGYLGDRLPRTETERADTARILQNIQHHTKFSLITVVDPNGRVIVRATNPAAFGDDTLMHEYENAMGPVSSIRHLVEAVLKGATVKSFEAFAPEILAPERVLLQGKPVTSLLDYAAIPLKPTNTAPVTPGSYEQRALMLTVGVPVFNSAGRIVGAVVAGRLINKDLGIVQEIRDVLQDHATIFLGRTRVVSTMKVPSGEYKGENATGTVYPEARQQRVAGGAYSEREFPLEGELVLGAYDPIRNHAGQVIGSFELTRPLSLLDSIASAQQQIENAVERRTTIYIVALAAISMIVAIVVASIFSKRITRQIDQLRKGADVIAEGNLENRLRVDSGDEIELLAQQFNLMASKLQDSYQTLEKKVEERTRELKASQEAMVQQEKMVGIGQLAAGIAHELNTPLGTIIGYAQMLREDLTAQPSSNGNIQDVSEIIEQAGRCRDLVKNLLNFSRRSTTEKSDANINVIIGKILSLIEHDFEMKGVQVHMDLDDDLPKVKVNENEIAQVILNLAKNAADSMPEGGDLRISTAYEATTDRVRIDVHDTGCGIEESDRNRVFEPFFTTKEVGKGTGLGLSICYKIVENHSGSMEFDSVIGQGTMFRVYIPVNAEVRVG
jgi:two-component system NtrC family sensor kinase